MGPRSILITGANRGLGLELVKQIIRLPSPPEHLFATCRNPSKAEELQELAKSNPSVKILKLDYGNLGSVQGVKDEVDSILEGQGLNVLLNNGGIHIRKGLAETTETDMMENYKTNVVGPVLVVKVASLKAVLIRNVTDMTEVKTVYEQTKEILAVTGLNLLINSAGLSYKKQYLGNIEKEKLIEQFDVNVFSPLLITQTFLPLLRQAADKNKDKGLSWDRAAIFNISSILGSIERNKTGGLYPYRASKAALNMVTRSLSNELQGEGILAASFHPGWVQTDMGGPKADITPEQSIQGLLQVFPKVDGTYEGRMTNFNGETLPW